MNSSILPLHQVFSRFVFAAVTKHPVFLRQDFNLITPALKISSTIIVDDNLGVFTYDSPLRGEVV